MKTQQHNVSSSTAVMIPEVDGSIVGQRKEMTKMRKGGGLHAETSSSRRARSCPSSAPAVHRCLQHPPRTANYSVSCPAAILQTEFCHKLGLSTTDNSGYRQKCAQRGRWQQHAWRQAPRRAAPNLSRKCQATPRAQRTKETCGDDRQPGP